MTLQELTAALHQYTPWEKLHLQYMGKFQDIENLNATLEKPIADNGKIIGLHLPRIPDQKNGIYSENPFFSDSSHPDIRIVQHDRYTPPLIHSHSFYELVYVYEGEFIQQIESTKLLMHTGDFALIPPGVRHSLDICNYSIVLNVLITENKFKNLIFYDLESGNPISYFFMNSTGSDRLNDFIIFHTEGDRAIQDLILDMCLEQLNRNIYCKYMINADLLKIIGLLLRCYGSTCDIPKIRRKKDDDNFNILRFIEQNYKTATLKDLANHFHYSEQHMSYRIRQLTGMPFTDYLRSKRMKVAADLLVNTNVKIKTIGENIGYQSQEHFIRTFRAHYGVTPGFYRSLHQKADQY